MFKTFLKLFFILSLFYRIFSKSVEREVQYLYSRQVYACVDSYFDSIMRSKKERNERTEGKVVCNEILITKSEDELYSALSHTRPTVPLYTHNHYYSLIDRNGSIIVNKMGTISGGECNGDLLFAEDVERVSKGLCDSSTGVTKVDSYPNGLALIVIKGKCDSLCVGRAVDDYYPGKGL